MGKPTGFLEYERSGFLDREPGDRIKDWKEFHGLLSDDDIKIQAARCMNCGIPFCQTGKIYAGAASGCPINNLIPDFNDLVYMGAWKTAYDVLSKESIFPEFTGRVCPAPCEGSCTLGLDREAVTIKQIELAIIEKAFAEGWVRATPPKERTGKKVAVVGSGPAGLACATELNRAGYSVTVYERNDRVGGLLMYGIPAMKLDKSIIERRVKLLEKEGIKFVINTEIGKNHPVEKILKNFDAVVLCCGSTRPRELTQDGRELQGIHFAMEFLHANTKSLLDSNHKDKKFISAKDKNVIVIGGGDTGTDCVATSIRHGCKGIKQFEILPCPPLERASTNPWPEWPKLLITDYGQEESAHVFGSDPRHFVTMTREFTGDKNGNVKELKTVQIEWTKKDGRFEYAEVPGTEKSWPADLVLLAMGFIGPEDKLLEEMGIERDERSNVKAEYGKFATNVKGVFAAGDMRRGQSLVVWAINEGRAAAKACGEFLIQS
ncbi:MAG: glutamate synthase subunit beta [Oligoflexia bacterium]|nr:glutamate synthase subunit beta [Oligoflexia bacterium]